MKLNGYNYYSYVNLNDVEVELSTPEIIALFGELFNEEYDNIFVSEGFKNASENGLIPFKVCTKTHGTSDEYEYHHIAVVDNESDAPTVYSVLFK